MYEHSPSYARILPNGSNMCVVRLYIASLTWENPKSRTITPSWNTGDWLACFNTLRTFPGKSEGSTQSWDERIVYTSYKSIHTGYPGTWYVLLAPGIKVIIQYIYSQYVRGFSSHIRLEFCTPSGIPADAQKGTRTISHLQYYSSVPVAGYPFLQAHVPG